MGKSRGGQGGAIVTISSMAALLFGPGGFQPYGAAKGGIDVVTQGLGKEVAGDGIRVNGIRPGLIDTDMQDETGMEKRIERLAPTIPIGRGGTADEVRRGYRALLDMARSDSFDAATTQDNAAQIRDALAKFKDLFPDGSQDADKWALPEIWSDRAGFERARQAADQAAADLAAVTAAEAYKPAFANLAAACKSCHDKFVRKED